MPTEITYDGTTYTTDEPMAKVRYEIEQILKAQPPASRFIEVTADHLKHWLLITEGVPITLRSVE